MQETKIIVAGSRSFSDYKLMSITLRTIFKRYKNIKIISGHARGADKLGEVYAWKHKIPLQVFPADWKTYGRRAGAIRNEKMASVGNVLVAFWDGISKGTLDMITVALEYELMVYIIDYRNNKVYIGEEANDIFGEIIPF